MRKEEYQNLLLEINENIIKIIDEFSVAIEKLQDKKEFVRIRILLAFSLAEVAAVIFERYFDLKFPNEKLMKEWFQTYCLTDKNEVYRGHPYFNKIDPTYLYDLRCSIIHAFALPEQKIPERGVTIINGTEFDSRIRELEIKFRNNGVEMAFISTSSLIKLFLIGARCMYEKISIPHESVTDENVAGLMRLKKEFFRRGAKYIPI